MQDLEPNAQSSSNSREIISLPLTIGRVEPRKVSEFTKGKVPLLFMQAALGLNQHSNPNLKETYSIHPSDLPLALQKAQEIHSLFFFFDQPENKVDVQILTTALAAADEVLAKDIWNIQPALRMVDDKEENTSPLHEAYMKVDYALPMFLYAAAAYLDEYGIADMDIAPFHPDSRGRSPHSALAEPPPHDLVTEIIIRPNPKLPGGTFRIKNLMLAAISHAQSTFRQTNSRLTQEDFLNSIKVLRNSSNTTPLDSARLRQLFRISDSIVEEDVKLFDSITPLFCLAKKK